jgi:hypothetical protein
LQFMPPQNKHMNIDFLSNSTILKGNLFCKLEINLESSLFSLISILD